MEITLDEIYQINQNIFNSQYKYISTLAKGSFGTVIKSLDLKTNKQVAVKIISKLNDAQEAINQLKKEVSVLKKTNHNNIVKLYDFYETSSEIYIIMEYIKGGTLKTYMKKNKENLNENTTKKIIFYLLNAINYLHKLKIIHSDIKPENIMFENEEDISTLKLIDFGLSSFNNKENEYCGTFLYMAPEILFNNKKLLTNEIDIWSVGIIMYQLLNKNIHPFFNKFELKKNKKDFLLEILKKYEKSNKLIFHNENYISRKAKNLLFNLLQIKSKNRIQSNLALNHIWFDDLNIKNYYLLDLNKKIFSEDDLKIINKGKKIFLTLIFLNQIKNHFFIKEENKNKSYSESTNNTEENSVLINNLKNVNFFIKKNKKIYKNINLKDKKNRNQIEEYFNKNNIKNIKKSNNNKSNKLLSINYKYKNYNYNNNKNNFPHLINSRRTFYIKSLDKIKLSFNNNENKKYNKNKSEIKYNKRNLSPHFLDKNNNNNNSIFKTNYINKNNKKNNEKLIYSMIKTKLNNENKNIFKVIFPNINNNNNNNNIQNHKKLLKSLWIIFYKYLYFL